MDEKITIIRTSKKKVKRKKKSHINKFTKLIYILSSLTIIVISFLIINMIFRNKSNETAEITIHSIFEEESKIQKNFCENETLFYNENFEKKIKLTTASFQNKKYKMFVYDQPDIVSYYINKVGNYENTETLKIFEALNYYSKKKNLTFEDMYILDIGANVGWYSFVFGKYGFKVISFEASKINNYILHKNYCLNKEVNITIINKGLYNEDKKCDIYNTNWNVGNGMIFCDKNSTIPKYFNPNKTDEIILTKLSNYIPLLSDKNIVLIKIDIEGSEGKVFQGGIELITKYHVPLIFLEFSPNSLRMHDTDPKAFLQLFIDNGYKIGLSGFFDKTIYQIEDIIKKTKQFTTLYIFYSNILG